MSWTEQLIFMLELAISFEVLWDVSCGASRGRTANVVGSQFHIQEFYVPSSSPPRRTHNGFQVYQLRTVRLLAMSDCSCTLYGLGTQKIDFCDLQICLEGAATFWADKDGSFSKENNVLLFGVSFGARDTIPSPYPLFLVSITCSFIAAAHVFRT